MKLSRTSMWVLGGSFLAAAGLLYWEHKKHAGGGLVLDTNVTGEEAHAVSLALAHETNAAALKSFGEAMADSPKASKALLDKAKTLPPAPPGPASVGGFDLFRTLKGIAQIPGSVVHEVEKIKPIGDLMHGIGKALNNNPFGKLLQNIWATVQANKLALVFGPLALAVTAVPGLLRGEKFDKAFLGWASWYAGAASQVAPGLGPEIMKQVGTTLQSVAPQLEAAISKINPSDLVGTLKGAGVDLSQAQKAFDEIKKAGLTKIGDVEAFAKQIGLPTDVVKKVDQAVRDATVGKLDPKELAKKFGVREDAAQHALDALLRKGSSFARDGAPATTSNGVQVPAIPPNPGKVFDMKTGQEVHPALAAPPPPPSLDDRKIDAVKSAVQAARAGDPAAIAHVAQIDRANARRTWVKHYLQ